MKIKILIALVSFLVGANTALAQSTEITYQGRLTDASMAANGNYDFQFALFSAAGGGAPIFSPLTRPSVAVSNGVFTVQLDFGAGAFPGADRFLEIGVRLAGGGSFTTLLPRQQITASSYGIRSLRAGTADTATNASQLGGVAANQYVVTSDARLSDSRSPTPGSANYIQNATNQQAASNFNISGNGTANIFSATTQYNIGANRVLTVTGSANTFAGIGAGTNATGDSNSFFGISAGGGLTNSGSSNSFFGERAGALNTTGTGNSFFGSAAGVSNTSGQANSFFGSSAGQSNTSGVDNSFFGVQAGFSNTTGTHNSFFGRGAGVAVTSATNNSFFGYNAGLVNTVSNNSFFGALAGEASTTGNNNSFFGMRAGNSNTDGTGNAFFGKDAGQANTTGSGNAFFGDNAGAAKTTSNGNSFFGSFAGANSTAGGSNSFFGSNAGTNTTGSENSFFGRSSGNLNTTGSNNTAIGDFANVGSGDLTFATALGAGAVVSSSNTIALGRSNAADKVVIYGLGAAGSTSLCRNASNQIATCSSSLRYKTDVNPFFGGLDVVRRLRPLAFNWRDGGMRDVGFAAEEVEQVEPLLTTRNDKGDIEGVKYGQLTTVLVNAVQQQQRLIEQQQKQLDEQRQQIESLRKIVCLAQSHAELCKERE